MARTILTLSHIAYTHPQSADPVLHDVSATFAQGWTALVGDNGCGKTTLARIACGLEKPDDGNVSARLSFAYCEQDPRMEPALLYDFACDFSPEATRLRAALEIPDDAPWRFESLSGGEQKSSKSPSRFGVSPNCSSSTSRPTTSTQHAVHASLSRCGHFRASASSFRTTAF